MHKKNKDLLDQALQVNNSRVCLFEITFNIKNYKRKAPPFSTKNDMVCNLRCIKKKKLVIKEKLLPSGQVIQIFPEGLEFLGYP